MIGRIGQKKPRAGYLAQRRAQDLVQEPLPPSRKRIQRLVMALSFCVMVLALTRE